MFLGRLLVVFESALFSASFLGCALEPSETEIETLGLGVRSPTGLVVLEWDPSSVVARIDGFSVERASSRQGPFQEFYFLDRSRRTLIDISYQEGDRTYYRVLGLQGSQVVAASAVTAATSTEVLPSTRLESVPPETLDTNQVTLRFSGESLLDGEVRQYTWHLDSDPWSQPTEEREIVLSALGVGNHEFEVRALDELGNLDPTPARASFTVQLDNDPRILIDDGKVATSALEVHLRLGANGGVTQMQVGEDPTLAAASWQSFENGIAFELSEGEGTKAVYARYRLQDGTDTAIVSDTIILDRTPPVGEVLAPLDGSAFTQDSVSVFGEVTDVSPVMASIQGYEDEAVAGSFSLPEIPLLVGDNPMVVELQDAVGLTATIPFTLWRHPASGACAF